MGSGLWLERELRSRWQACNGAGNRPGIEGPKVAGALADADGVDRHSEPLRRRNQHAAACRSVELGHDEAGHASALLEDFDLVEGILPRRGVEDEQDVM